jgi:hypothetical protein
MDRLWTLQPKISPEANAQAAAVCDLMEKAHKEHASDVTFSVAGGMHPLVLHALTTKGYRVDEIQNRTLVYSPQNVKHYKIT